MVLKNTWVSSELFYAADQNAVATQVNTNTTDIASLPSPAAWAAADAFIDFTTKSNGDPPTRLDTGQAVDFTWGPSNWKPQISSGKLITGTLPGSGNYADYYQAQLDGDCRAFGARWTVNSADGSTQGVSTLAAWAGIYQTSGTIVPRHAAHVTYSTTTGAWNWYVSDGLDNANFIAVKSGTFTAPASDGSAVWDAAVYLDPDNGVGYGYLPGNDATTGTRFITVTNAEIAAAQTAATVPVRTLAYLIAGTSVVQCEHQASTAANTAIYPRFLNMWGEVLRFPRDRARAIWQEATKAPPATLTGSSGTAKALTVAPTINQSGTAGYSALSVEVTETATGSGNKRPVDVKVGGSSIFNVDNTGRAYIAFFDLGAGDCTFDRVAAGRVVIEGREILTSRRVINTQTGTSYTLVLADAGQLVTLSNASAITLTVPTNASVAFAVGDCIDLAQLGAGQVTIAGAGVTLQSTPGLKISARYGGAKLVKLATDTWLVTGNLSA